MSYDELLKIFIQFGLAVLVGILIGLERESRESAGAKLGLRDFVLVSLIGAFSAFLAMRYDAIWIIALGFAGLLALVLSGYWARGHGPGITTELAAIMTFFLGVLILFGAPELAIALAIVTLAVLFPKAAIKRMTGKVSAPELQAVLLFLTISFIVLPVLPNRNLDLFATFEVGTIEQLDTTGQRIVFESAGTPPELGTSLPVIDEDWNYIGTIAVVEVGGQNVVGRFEGDNFASLAVGQTVRGRLDFEALYVLLSAVNPYRIWLIVVLVSFVSFLGYVLIRIFGSSAGTGLTGMIGGLVSSTVTTLSFARRSKEHAAAAPLFAAAVILASSVMFPRLIVQIGVFNATLMKSIAVPLVAMGIAGLLMASYAFWRHRSPDAGAAPHPTFSNPFSLRSAVSFAVVFTLILVATRLATTYLGSAWLPVVAIVSGLTDADAIAFSISGLQRSGLISLDWASFNLVLGALANTFMKLAIVFSLGTRALFRQVLWGFLVIGSVGIVTMLVYYDLTIPG